jgi:hypothetical protein
MLLTTLSLPGVSGEEAFGYAYRREYLFNKMNNYTLRAQMQVPL